MAETPKFWRYVIAVWLASAVAGAAWGLSSVSPGEPEERTPAVSQNELTNERIANYTLALAVFSGLLFVAACLQAIFLYRSNLVAARIASAGQKSADTAAEAFSKLERPYLFVFGVGKIKRRGPMGGQPHVTFSVGNYGKSPAIIMEVCAQFSVGYEPEPPLAIEEDHDLRARPVFSAGATRSDLTDNVPDFVDLTVDLQPVLEAGSDLFYQIIIYYRGPFTDGHETSACWHYDSRERVFVSFGGDDFNYAK